MKPRVFKNGRAWYVVLNGVGRCFDDWRAAFQFALVAAKWGWV